MLIIAHRGANKQALENSWEAFQKALEYGSDRIELDVQISRDHKLFVMHDESLLRTTGVNRVVEDLTSHELARIKLKNGEEIPRLDDVLRTLTPKLEINIEIKSANPRVAQHSAKLVKEMNCGDRVIFSSFCPPPLDLLAAEYPQFRRAVLWARWTSVKAPWYRYTPQLFMIRAQTKIIHPETFLVTESFMDQALSRGWQVVPYVSMVSFEDDAERRSLEWQRLYELGILGLCTNEPRALSQWLAALKKSSNKKG